MKIDDDVQSILDKVQTGTIDGDLQAVDSTPFGLYMPAYVDGDTLKLIPNDYTQLEANLKITITKKGDSDLDKSEAVAWLGSLEGKDSRCKHGGTSSCSHCTYHDSSCRHCSSHEDKVGISDLTKHLELEAPMLDYDGAYDLLKSKDDLLRSLSKERLGLALLHGHSSTHKFTQLPPEYVSVISKGETHFRKAEEVADDPTFVPNMWRMMDGRLQPAGGFSEM